MGMKDGFEYTGEFRELHEGELDRIRAKQERDNLKRIVLASLTQEQRQGIAAIIEDFEVVTRYNSDGTGEDDGTLTLEYLSRHFAN